MMLEIAIIIISILNSNCYMPIDFNHQRARTLSQYDQLTTSRFSQIIQLVDKSLYCILFSNLGWVKKDKLINKKIVTLGDIPVGVCRYQEAGVVKLGSLTRNGCFLVEGRAVSEGWEVHFSSLMSLIL